MNEFQAALGLLQLKYADQVLTERKHIAETYKIELSSIEGIRFLENMKEVTHNYAYFPIFIDRKKYSIDRDTVYNKFRENNIYARRYFYPLISQFPTYKQLESSAKGNLKAAEKITQEVLCLPIYPGLTQKEQSRVINILRRC